MLGLRRLCVCSLSIFAFAISLFGQRLSPVIAAAATGEKVRVSAPGNVAQIRVQILSTAGESVFDSAWMDGNVLDWSADRIADGTYRWIVTSRDLDGQVAQKEGALFVRDRQVAIDPVAEKDDPKITLLVHDEKAGAIVNTDGDLSFRIGKFFAGKDVERMRVTAEGNVGIGTDKPQARLDVNGSIRASEGIMFSDGTILTSSDGNLVIQKSAGPQGRAVQTVLRPQTAATPRRLTPAPNVVPVPQFNVDAAGVHIGTTTAYGLDVMGDVTLTSNLNLPLTSASGNAGVVMLAFNRYLHSANGGTNTFLGVTSGNFTTTGTNNTGIGQSSLFSVADGSDNTAVGLGSLNLTTSGGDNTAVGNGAMRHNTLGGANTAIGSGALDTNTTGGNNTAVGEDALESNTTGANNIAVGFLAGLSLTTGNNNIDIGHQGFAAEEKTIRIGTSGNQTRAFMAGVFGVTTGVQNAVNVMVDSNGQLGTVSSSRRFKFDIADMGDATANLMRLRPVTFRYLQNGEHAARQYGLIAEEVAEVYPEMVARDQAGEINTVMYQFLAPMLLNEVQRQHRKIEEQSTTIEILNKTLEALEGRIHALEARAK